MLQFSIIVINSIKHFLQLGENRCLKLFHFIQRVCLDRLAGGGLIARTRVAIVFFLLCFLCVFY